MYNVKLVNKVFHKAKIECEKHMNQGKNTWAEYVFFMLGFEEKAARTVFRSGDIPADK
jgi:hypothetical protein